MARRKNQGRNQTKMFTFFAVLLIAVVGATTLVVTRAATSYISIEAEGSVTNPPPPPPPPATDMNVYFGSTHNHTGCCNDHGEDSTTPTDIFNLAKQNNFDFLFITEHTNPRSVGDSAVKTAMNNNATDWFNKLKALAVSASTSNFIGFAGVESGDPGSNHMTLVNQDDFFFASSPSDNINYLVSQLDKGNKIAFGGFNHPGSGGHGGASASNISTKSREVMVFSGVQYGTSDSSRDGAGYSAYIVHLDRGWRVGPTCELDGHGKFRLESWNEARSDTCRIGVLAPTLTRDNLNDAFANRRFFVARDTNLEVGYKANGQWMGSKIGKPSNVDFEITVNDPSTSRSVDKIKKIDIITEGGAVVASKSFDAHSVSWNTSVPANGKKYFFLRIFNGEYSYQAAVTAPVWLE